MFVLPRRLLAPLVICSVTLGLSACIDDAPSVTMGGTVQSGDTPLGGYNVTLYRTDGAGGGTTVELASATTNDAGGFGFEFEKPWNDLSVYFMVADNSAGLYRIQLATSLGTEPDTDSDVIINERTTVATAYAMAQFISSQGNIGGSYPGLQNAAATVQNLANITTGEVGSVLGSEPNGMATTTMRAFNSLANMLAACVGDQVHCATLFNGTTPEAGTQPRNTLLAMRNLARMPWLNADALFRLSQQSSIYTPQLASAEAPTAWTIAIRYIGDGPEGQQLDGPGNVAFDADGNGWIANNYQFSLDPTDPNICGGQKAVKLTPTGGSAPDAPYFGGGTYGAGFGVTVDLDGNAWIGNFGFQGAACDNDFLSLSQSLSKFGPDGEILSPDNGTMIDGLSMPQGMVVDQGGNIWVAGCTSDNVLKIPATNPDASQSFDDLELNKPFDVTIDHSGHAWVSSTEGSAILELDNNGQQIGEIITDPEIIRPMGVATDSLGNVWASVSGVLDPPCPTPSPDDILIDAVGDDGELNTAAAVAFIQPDGAQREVTVFRRDEVGETRRGLRIPWGIAVDGNDNVFVANFAGQRLMVLCGAREENCPEGTNTGDAIGLDQGFPSDALTRNTGVQIDPSGNVWLPNNWIINAFDNIGTDQSHQNNPGGHAMVVYIGLAAPVKTPMVGPPRRP